MVGARALINKIVSALSFRPFLGLDKSEAQSYLRVYLSVISEASAYGRYDEVKELLVKAEKLAKCLGVELGFSGCGHYIYGGCIPPRDKKIAVISHSHISELLKQYGLFSDLTHNIEVPVEYAGYILDDMWYLFPMSEYDRMLEDCKAYISGNTIYFSDGTSCKPIVSPDRVSGVTERYLKLLASDEDGLLTQVDFYYRVTPYVFDYDRYNQEVESSKLVYVPIIKPTAEDKVVPFRADGLGMSFESGIPVVPVANKFFDVSVSGPFVKIDLKDSYGIYVVNEGVFIADKSYKKYDLMPRLSADGNLQFMVSRNESIEVEGTRVSDVYIKYFLFRGYLSNEAYIRFSEPKTSYNVSTQTVILEYDKND